jgi:hypothetical protein
MLWVDITKTLPQYYEVVSLKLKNNKIIEGWRASDGDKNIYTEFKTNRIYYTSDILSWKRHKIESKTQN